MKKADKRCIGSSFIAFLDEQGLREEVESNAIKPHRRSNYEDGRTEA